jgi:methyl-accepting chemotaxis protein
MKRQRKRYLINKKYQLGLLVILLSIIFLVIYVSVVATHYFVLASIIAKMEQSSSIPTGMELIQASIKPAVIIVPIVVVISAIAVVYIIFISHRTAGPLHKLKSVMGKVGEGDLSMRLKFRRNDEIHDVAESFNKMVEGLRKKFDEKKER